MLQDTRIGRVLFVGLLAMAVPVGLCACGDEDDGDGDGAGANGGGGEAGGGNAGGGAGAGGGNAGGGTGGSSSSTFGCCVNGSGYSCPSLEAANACNASACTPDNSQCSSSNGGGAAGGNGGTSGGGGSSDAGASGDGPCAGKSENDSCINDWGVTGYCCESFNSNNQRIGLSCWEDPC